MHRSLARCSAPVSFVQAPSWADFITTMVGFEVFGTHNIVRRKKAGSGCCGRTIEAKPFRGQTHPFQVTVGEAIPENRRSRWRSVLLRCDRLKRCRALIGRLAKDCWASIIV